jgi:hypothetical protein
LKLPNGRSTVSAPASKKLGPRFKASGQTVDRCLILLTNAFAVCDAPGHTSPAIIVRTRVVSLLSSPASRVLAAARVLAEYAPHLRDPIVLGLVVWLFNCSKSDERAGAKTAAGAAASPTAKLEPACDQVIEGVDEHSFSNARALDYPNHLRAKKRQRRPRRHQFRRQVLDCAPYGHRGEGASHPPQREFPIVVGTTERVDGVVKVGEIRLRARTIKLVANQAAKGRFPNGPANDMRPDATMATPS